MTEELDQAQQGAQDAVRHLRRALASADAVQSLVLLPLIQQAAELERRIGELAGAIALGKRGA